MSKKKHWTVIDIAYRQPRVDGEPFPMARLVHNPVSDPPLPQDTGSTTEAARTPIAPENTTNQR
jgi:hypothetical protein